VRRYRYAIDQSLTCIVGHRIFIPSSSYGLHLERRCFNLSRDWAETEPRLSSHEQRLSRWGVGKIPVLVQLGPTFGLLDSAATTHFILLAFQPSLLPGAQPLPSRSSFFLIFFIHTAYESKDYSKRGWVKWTPFKEIHRSVCDTCWLWSSTLDSYTTCGTLVNVKRACMKGSFSSPLTTDRLVGHSGCSGPPISAMIDIHPEVLLPLS
jgi:hypothetical protein